ncbi:MAG: M13 family metallopeptidase [Kofleriaceae bacterium]
MTRTVLFALLVAACGKSADKKEAPPPPPPPKAAPADAAAVATPPVAADPAIPALDTKGMDTSVKPGDDFYNYASGTWMKNTEIPADRAAWGAFSVATEMLEKRLAQLIADAQKSSDPEAKKVGDFYTSWMDTAGIEKKGYTVLKPDLDAIAAISDAKSLATAIGGTLRADVDVTNASNFATTNLFGFWIAADVTAPTKYVAYMLQGGLGMPNRDFYLDSSKRMAELRDKYKAHIAKMLTLAGQANADDAATKILALETAIAKVHATELDTQDVKNGVLRWKREDFAKNAPGIEWDALFAAAKVDKVAEFGPWHPKAITGIAALVKSQPIDTWKAYLTFHAIDRHGTVLPAEADKEMFAFYGTALAGVPEQRTREKRGLAMVQANLGWSLGKLYVAKYFTPEAKAKITTMVTNIIAAFDKRIDTLTWMAPETKAKAKAKLKVFKVGVGYPDKWRDFGGLDIKADDLYGNVDRASAYDYAWNLARLDQPVDRDEWVMVPELVNAVNLPVLNSMNFPAAILQPPFYDPNRPDVLNYGAIGAVIGHEISHSFDNTGAQFDDTGKLANWWTKDDFKKFAAQGDALVAQYNAYKPFPDASVNGKQTLGENIADVAGLAIAYDAYKASGTTAPAIDGLTPDQQFYLSFAMSWRTKMREPAARQRLLVDGHSPGQYRAATVRNQDGWYQAFDVKPTDKLYLAPDKRVKVW